MNSSRDDIKLALISIHGMYCRYYYTLFASNSRMHCSENSLESSEKLTKNKTIISWIVNALQRTEWSDWSEWSDRRNRTDWTNQIRLAFVNQTNKTFNTISIEPDSRLSVKLWPQTTLRTAGIVGSELAYRYWWISFSLYLFAIYLFNITKSITF